MLGLLIQLSASDGWKGLYVKIEISFIKKKYISNTNLSFTF